MAIVFANPAYPPLRFNGNAPQEGAALREGTAELYLDGEYVGEVLALSMPEMMHLPNESGAGYACSPYQIEYEPRAA